jgi:hypothetical protein
MIDDKSMIKQTRAKGLFEKIVWHSSAEEEYPLMRDVTTPFFREFDPGSGRTLAACLTHASRAVRCLTLSIRACTEAM